MQFKTNSSLSNSYILLIDNVNLVESTLQCIPLYTLKIHGKFPTAHTLFGHWPSWLQVNFIKKWKWNAFSVCECSSIGVLYIHIPYSLKEYTLGETKLNAPQFLVIFHMLNPISIGFFVVNLLETVVSNI